MSDRCSSNGTEATVGGESEGLSELFDVLSNRRRRYAIYCLDRYETPMALADLTDEIVRLETDALPTAVPEMREQVYTHLYHRHLPKLAEANIITFDMTESLVSLGDAATDIRPYLQQIPEEEWPSEK